MQNKPTGVSVDGSINIFDLVTVAGNVGQSLHRKFTEWIGAGDIALALYSITYIQNSRDVMQALHLPK